MSSFNKTPCATCGKLLPPESIIEGQQPFCDSFCRARYKVLQRKSNITNRRVITNNGNNTSKPKNRPRRCGGCGKF